MAAAEIAGIKKLKIYNTVNTKMEFKHPNYYKNLRKLARLRNRDQAISEATGTPTRQSVRLGPASSNKPTSIQALKQGGRVGPKDSS